MGDGTKGMERIMLIRRLTEVVNGRVVWTAKSKSWLKNDPDLVLSMVKRGLMESGFYLDPSYDLSVINPVEIFMMPTTWRQKATDGKFFDIGVELYEDSTFNIMYDLGEHFVYLDGADVEPLKFWDEIYECFDSRLSCEGLEDLRRLNS